MPRLISMTLSRGTRTSAGSAAVFGPAEAYPGGVVSDDSPQQPDGTLYGVFKHANEHTRPPLRAGTRLGQRWTATVRRLWARP